MLLVLYRDLKKGAPAQPAPHQIKKSATPNKKKGCVERKFNASYHI